MGHSQADKAHTLERILAEASEQVRDAGLESVSVQRLMRSVGLTHGGFYVHFQSRSDLLARALARALHDGAASSAAAQQRSPLGGFVGQVKSYLSRRHRDARRTGCAIAALAGDAARADEASRAVMSEHVEHYVASVARQLGGDEGKAMFAVSALVGSLLLSRVLTDTARSDQLLAASRAALLDLASGTAQRDRPGDPPEG